MDFGLQRLFYHETNMYSILQQRLHRINNANPALLLQDRLIGLEREALRVAPDGYISQVPHPLALGATLTHPLITTDYSEALLEFITPPLPSAEAALQCMDEIHRFVYPHIGDELLWSASMPCILAGEDSIPIGQYGRSNRGQMKHIYRCGLSWRYGRMMQVIAGIHFNFSLSEAFWSAFQQLEGDQQSLADFRSAAYFGLIRNLQRFGWLVLFLFGASPAVCKSFLNGRETTLLDFDDHTSYAPYATSLRMSNIGYNNRTEKKSGVSVSYSSLDEYVASLLRATRTPWPTYEQIGVKVNGEYRQLNTNILQVENEYYTTMRPKQPPQTDEMPALALQRRGVAYVELRSLDINPWQPLGMNAEQLQFLEAFLLLCLLAESPVIDEIEQRMIDDNQMATALNGRDPALCLERRHTPALPLRDWANELLDELEPICALLDAGTGVQRYAATLAAQRDVVADPAQTPSAQLLMEMQERGENFFRHAKRLSAQHRQFFAAPPLDAACVQRFNAAAERSLQEQERIEAADSMSLEQFLADYFAQQ